MPRTRCYYREPEPKFDPLKDSKNKGKEAKPEDAEDDPNELEDEDENLKEKQKGLAAQRPVIGSFDEHLRYLTRRDALARHECAHCVVSHYYGVTPERVYLAAHGFDGANLIAMSRLTLPQQLSVLLAGAVIGLTGDGEDLDAARQRVSHLPDPAGVMRAAAEEARGILLSRRNVWDQLSGLLLDRQQLTGADIIRVLGPTRAAPQVRSGPQEREIWRYNAAGARFIVGKILSVDGRVWSALRMTRGGLDYVGTFNNALAATRSL
jgi:hypothetical protein